MECMLQATGKSDSCQVDNAVHVICNDKQNSLDWCLVGCSLLGGMNTRRVYTAHLPAPTESFQSAAAFPMGMARHALTQHRLIVTLPMATYPLAQQALQGHGTLSKSLAYNKLCRQYKRRDLGWIPCSLRQSIHRRGTSMPPILLATACTLLEGTAVSLLRCFYCCCYCAAPLHAACAAPPGWHASYARRPCSRQALQAYMP